MSQPAAARSRLRRSSMALQATNSSMSGWSTLSSTILAALLVLPPERIAPAELSAPAMKLTGPDAIPPPDRRSVEPRMADRLTPAPLPPRKIRPSVRIQSKISGRESPTGRMKQADTCCLRSGQPTLKYTGLLKAARWSASTFHRCSQKSLSKLGSGELSYPPSAKYPPSRAHRPIVPTTLESTCRNEVSRSSVPGVPQKYFDAAICAACWDQDSGNSTPGCSHTTPPSPPTIRRSRRDHPPDPTLRSNSCRLSWTVRETCFARHSSTVLSTVPGAAAPLRVATVVITHPFPSLSGGVSHQTQQRATAR